MAARFWPMTALVMMSGITSLYLTLGMQKGQPRTSGRAMAEGAAFVVYRNAVLAYVEQNPATLGAVPLASLQLTPGYVSLPGQGNNVVATASGQGRIILAWAALPASAVWQAVNDTGGDMSFGIVNGTTWTSPVGGASTLPAAVPNGDVVSVTQTGV